MDYVLNSAGVWVAWKVCGAIEVPTAPRLTVRIRFSPVPVEQYAPAWESGRAFRVRRRQEYAEVFVETIRRFASGRMIDTGELLGCSMLHEISHLLGNPHSLRGIMAPTFEYAEEDALVHRRLRFTKDERSKIVQELRRRNHEEIASTLAIAARPGAR